MMMSMYVCLSLCFGYVLLRLDFNFNEGNILVNTSLYIALATCQTFERERGVDLLAVSREPSCIVSSYFLNFCK